MLLRRTKRWICRTGRRTSCRVVMGSLPLSVRSFRTGSMRSPVLRCGGLSWSMLFGTGRVPGAGIVGERRSWDPVRAGRGVLGAPVVRQARAAASCGRRRNGGARLQGGASSALSTPWVNHQSGAAKTDQRVKERRQRFPDRHSESYQRAPLPDSRLGKGARGARITKTDSNKDERVHPGLPRNERR